MKQKMINLMTLVLSLWLGLFSDVQASANKPAPDTKSATQHEGHAAAVILQYHHVSAKTPASTSVSPETFKVHLDWLAENKFTIISIDTLVDHLKNKKPFATDRNVVITFDDAGASVCDTAWPILKERKLPFTVFINTQPLEQSYRSQCKWEELKTMLDSGLMTAGNHTHTHAHMVSAEFGKGDWRAAALKEIKDAESIIEKELGVKPTVFAYPYGEYNETLTKLVGELGLVGFGQHSGAIGFHSDLTALPRYPAAGTYANIKTLATKMRTLPYAAEVSFNAQNPLPLAGNTNPPLMIIKPANPAMLKTTRCYDGVGKVLGTKIVDGAIHLQNANTLPAGRNRYTCTAPSPLRGRYYWLSQQWLVE